MKLKNNESIVIKKADKGGAVAIMTTRHYQQIIYDHLNDCSTYKKLDKDTHKGILKLLMRHTNKHSNCLTEDEGKYFKNISQTATFTDYLRYANLC